MSRSTGARRRNSVPSSRILKGGYNHRVRDDNGKPVRELNDRVLGRYVFFSKTFRSIEVPNPVTGVMHTEYAPDPGEIARRWVDEHGNLQYISQRDVNRIIAERKAAQEKANADSD